LQKPQILPALVTNTSKYSKEDAALNDYNSAAWKSSQAQLVPCAKYDVHFIWVVIFKKLKSRTCAKVAAAHLFYTAFELQKKQLLRIVLMHFRHSYDHKRGQGGKKAPDF